jgi:hypothetical protein
LASFPDELDRSKGKIILARQRDYKTPPKSQLPAFITWGKHGINKFLQRPEVDYTLNTTPAFTPMTFKILAREQKPVKHA